MSAPNASNVCVFMVNFPSADYDFVSRPPRDAVRFMEAKALKQGWSYQDVWREEHATAFTVAKATSMDVLKTIHKGVQDAINQGTTLQDFKDNLTPLLQEAGWWGRKESLDPLTGKKRLVQLGSERRLEIIYNTNIRMARSAGLWERAQLSKATHGYAEWNIGPSSRHRAEHISWVGLVLPIDDEWWTSHWPPNGWGCNCWVKLLTKKEGRARAGTAPEIEYVEHVNTRTGEVTDVPKGIDPGFDYNPGAVARERHAVTMLVRKAGEAPPSIGAHAGAARWFREDLRAMGHDFISEAQAGAVRPQIKKIVGFVPPTVPELLADRGVTLGTAAIVAAAAEVLQLGGDLDARLVDVILDPEYAVWDAVSSSLLLFPRGRLRRPVRVLFAKDDDGTYRQVGLGIDTENIRRAIPGDPIWTKPGIE